MTECVLFTMHIFWLSIFAFLMSTPFRTMLILKDFFLIFSCIIRVWRPVLYSGIEDALALKKGRNSSWKPTVHTFCNVLSAVCNAFFKLMIYHYSSVIFTRVDEIPVYSFRESRIQCVYGNLCCSSFARLYLSHYEQPFRNVLLCVLHASVSSELDNIIASICTSQLSWYNI